jgi:hypothetical protein
LSISSFLEIKKMLLIFSFLFLIWLIIAIDIE